MDKPFILLVDDNEATTTLMTALLQKDFNLEIAADGVDAVQLLRTKTYAAVILDLLMPQMDGYGVLDFLTENKPEILKRVLIVTAALTRHEISRVSKYDVCAVISKPFEVDHLVATIRKCVATSGSLRGPIVNPSLILLVAEILRHRWI